MVDRSIAAPTMSQRAAAFFAANPALSFAALGAADNESALDLAPFGQAARYFAAERSPEMIARYRASNQIAFTGAFALPGWVLSDLYLLPGAVGLLLGPAALLPESARLRLGLEPEDEAVVAGYVAAPSLAPGCFIGISLFSLLPQRGVAAWVKALTLGMYRARRLRGVAQWDNPSVRVHTRMGPLRLVGPVAGGHELAARSFVYQNDLDDESRWAEAMARRLCLEPTQRIPSGDLPTLAALLQRAAAGDEIYLVPPGLHGAGEILVRAG